MQLRGNGYRARSRCAQASRRAPVVRAALGTPGHSDAPIELKNGKVVSGPDLSVVVNGIEVRLGAACRPAAPASPCFRRENGRSEAHSLSNTRSPAIHARSQFPNPFVIGSGPPGEPRVALRPVDRVQLPEGLIT